MTSSTLSQVGFLTASSNAGSDSTFKGCFCGFRTGGAASWMTRVLRHAAKASERPRTAVGSAEALDAAAGGSDGAPFAAAAYEGVRRRARGIWRTSAAFHLSRSSGRRAASPDHPTMINEERGCQSAVGGAPLDGPAAGAGEVSLCWQQQPGGRGRVARAWRLGARERTLLALVAFTSASSASRSNCRIQRW